MKDGEKDQTRGIRGEQAQVRIHADGDILRQAGRNSESDGGEQVGSIGETLTTADTEWREATLGKILSQLEELREAHLAYVNAHTDRLRARLAEDEEHRSQILAGMDELREQIILQMEKVKASNVKPTVDASDEEG